MWTLINQFDVTSNVNLDIQIQAAISDPLARLDFSLDDPGCTLNVQEGQEVLVWDETSTYPPALNFARNTLLQNDGGGSTHVPGFWSVAGTNGNLFVWTNNTFQTTMVFNNSPVTWGSAYQSTLVNAIVPGQTYMMTCDIQGTGIVNVQSFVQMQFQDAGGNNLGSQISRTDTPTVTMTRYSIQGTAPAGAAYIVFSFGGQATNATNAGTITFDEPQCEPMWFVGRGVSYPTYYNNFDITTSTVLPDQTISRTCRLFAGYIDDLTSAYEGNNRTYTISCAGPGSILESNGLININYSVPTLDSTIIGNIITTYYAGVLATGSPHTQTYSTTVQPGAVIQALSVNDGTFREVLNGMADTSGYVFYVDNYYYLRYQPVYWDTTSITISDNPDYVTSYPPQEYTIEKDATQLKNRVKVVGGKFLAPALTDTFSPNGSNKTFALSFQPYNIQSVTLSGASQKVGVNGVNTYSQGYLALYDKGSQQLIYNVAPVTGTNTLLVTYTYEAPVAVQVQSLDSYALYKRWFDSKVNDTSLTSLQAATNRGLNELTQWAFARPVLTLNLFQYIYPGTTVLFTSAHDGYTNKPFTIQTMTTTTDGNGVYTYQYQCGYYTPTFVDHLRNQGKALNRSQTTANVTAAVQTDIVTSDTIAYTDSVSAATAATSPYVYGVALYGYSTIA